MTMRIATSPLSGRIQMGRINKSGTSFIGNTTDVTSDVLSAIIEKSNFHGGSFIIQGSNGTKFTITVDKS